MTRTRSEVPAPARFGREYHPSEMLTIFFLSDYGLEDEFVGVVHAVLDAAVPGVTVIDLTHQVPAFDVRAGAHTLVRAAPHLGPGVVLAVVDPGVGSSRRGLCLEIEPPPSGRLGPRFFVGPDNGLLVAAAELVGAGRRIARAFALAVRTDAARPARTFDGRDLFAPAAAALARGTPPEALGEPIDPASLVRLEAGAVELVRREDGRHTIRTEVIWVDHFGNLQLAATAADARAAGLPVSGVVAFGEAPGTTIRLVATFADLAPGEVGLLVDANDHLAVVAGAASATRLLAIGVRDVIELTW
jgi:S-adenosylmethionine hydrolase